jgi:Domain of unknown function (DUF3854)
VNPHLALLISAAYSGALDPEHLADLRKSGLADETIRRQRIRSVPPHMIDPLLRFEAPKVLSAYVVPFADPRGGWMDHVRMKVFPPITTEKGTIKYLQPRRSGVRIFFPVNVLDAVLRTADPLYVVEGEKKALAVAQLGIPTVGIAGVEGWHQAGDRTLHPDFDDIGLRGRVVNVIPDADVRTNLAVRAAVHRLAEALFVRGATANLVRVPDGFKGIDDWLAARA